MTGLTEVDLVNLELFFRRFIGEYGTHYATTSKLGRNLNDKILLSDPDWSTLSPVVHKMFLTPALP